MTAKKSSTDTRTQEIEGCPFCRNGDTPDYKDYKSLKKFITERARIVNRTKSGVCSKHQRRLTREIKKARYLGLLPYTPAI